MSRHNLGFMVVDALAHHLSMRFKPGDEALVAEGSCSGKALRLVKPLSYMNQSGRVLKRILAGNHDDFLVVVDDVDLEFTRLRLRKQGGASGHNGLESVAYHLGTEEYPRLRLGIGPRPPGADLSDYVLETFSPDELEEVKVVVSRAADACLLVLEKGIDVAMNEVNP
ncbi:aminoacyl-tRNA hydrolase [candidate division WOR-3 bacterium]|uniref:Aminoacyl-tRNA hydrolase n=1 Tax=candidate division WOR-3 bacterium TaxID=2052148 RepID=A0A9D5K7C3_UNCW3|nr:aminoacyl-tRNA hydrolase [candidate division WOR-3 bacterium]MBD3363592.1 aminoacyl-tRNA hydrolase [candidate division WOR-3 bacterium]